MKFVYIGQGDSPPERILFMGRIDFTLNGDAVDVDDDALIAKLRGNRCFVEVVEEVAPEPPAPEPAPEAPVFTVPVETKYAKPPKPSRYLR
jgi:hypothetical protein